MKKKQKGFVLVETLVVSLLVLTVLIFLFLQLNTINLNYQKSFRYNTVEGLYSANNMKIYILKNGYENLVKEMNEKKSYIDITNCQNSSLNNTSQCSNLIKALQIKKILFTTDNVESLLTQNEVFEQKFLDFMKYMKTNQENKYRLIIAFENDTYATIKF